jgi:hypothetical protein
VGWGIRRCTGSHRAAIGTLLAKELFYVLAVLAVAQVYVCDKIAWNTTHSDCSHPVHNDTSVSTYTVRQWSHDTVNGGEQLLLGSVSLTR